MWRSGLKTRSIEFPFTRPQRLHGLCKSCIAVSLHRLSSHIHGFKPGIRAGKYQGVQHMVGRDAQKRGGVRLG
jgi:hypothetical protein